MDNDPNLQPPQPPYGQSSYEQQYSQQPQPAASYPTPPYGVPTYPPPVYVPVQQPQQSNKTLWIVLGVIGGILLLLVATCCGTFYYIGHTATVTLSNVQLTAVANEASPEQQAQNYYQAISEQNYTGAYDYLASNATQSDGTTFTLTTFQQQAEALDASEGTVQNYTVTVDPNDSSKVTVQVTRSGGKTYMVHLTFRQGYIQWEISSLDTI